MPLDDKEKEEIRKEAQAILAKFSKALEKIKTASEGNVERKEDRRSESDHLKQDDDFRRLMFENAPTKSDEFIFAEKKSW